ncbi:DUF4345 domain-containing protein [Pseudomonas atacamensis]|uniref:DUF4345 domain-containing protein n=1 Tax=Pseudomonas atacamensis TaxID=2565368 RepID=UPI001C3E4CD0|nr:DUF4345 domain-containing protein [Pseudomonas atacamensis]QXH74813.1 DUF4345 domain-containing protein [Pseudomonas atacamensis]
MNTVLKKYFLILSFLIVSSIALIYGISPVWFARTFLGINDVHRDVAHILTAIMGLYLALGGFWLVSAYCSLLRGVALLTVLIFCVGLVFGRLISFILDGVPSPLLQFYAAVELTVIPVAYWLMKLRDN